jgi:hypothetical protein
VTETFNVEYPGADTETAYEPGAPPTSHSTMPIAGVEHDRLVLVADAFGISASAASVTPREKGFRQATAGQTTSHFSSPQEARTPPRTTTRSADLVLMLEAYYPAHAWSTPRSPHGNVRAGVRVRVPRPDRE